jgi:hypothetical protein
MAAIRHNSLLVSKIYPIIGFYLREGVVSPLITLVPNAATAAVKRGN